MLLFLSQLSSFCHMLLFLSQLSSFCHMLLFLSQLSSFCHMLLFLSQLSSFCHICSSFSLSSFCHMLLFLSQLILPYAPLSLLADSAKMLLFLSWLILPYAPLSPLAQFIPQSIPSRSLRLVRESFLDVPGPKDCKTKQYSQRDFGYITPSEWKALPWSVRETDSVHSFWFTPMRCSFIVAHNSPFPSCLQCVCACVRACVLNKIFQYFFFNLR